MPKNVYTLFKDFAIYKSLNFTIYTIILCVCVRVHELHLLSGVTLFGSFFILVFVVQHTVEGFKIVKAVQFSPNRN